ncbi:MAG: NAD-dependent epimerase/dehydratase family protein [Armatimonadota bacterium]
MGILVTGATGRVGANLVRALADRGDEVKCLVYPGDPQEPKLEPLDAEVWHGDLTDTEAVAAAAEGVEYIIHAGAVMGEPKAGAENFLDINVMGTHRLLEAAVANETRRFVYISSTAIYCVDRVSVHPTPEDAPLDPLRLYGASKKMAEALVQSYAREHELPYVILRPGDIRACDEVLNGWTVRSTAGIYRRGARNPLMHYYVDDDPEPWREIEALAEAKGSALCAATDANGDPWERHSCDVRDVVGASLAALESDAALGGVFNVAAPEAMPQPELTEYLASETGDEVVSVATPTRRRVNCSVEKIAATFYQPIYGWRRMIDDALALKAGEDIGVIPT